MPSFEAKGRGEVMGSTDEDTAATGELDAAEGGAADWDASPDGEPDDPSQGREVPALDESASEGMPSFLKDEIAPVLAAAERAAGQIVDRAREQARAQNAELEQNRQRVESRIAELVAWQESVEPSIRSLQVRVADIQSKIEEVPELIRKALDPVATAISGLDPTLADVAAASRPVLDLDQLPANFGQPMDGEA
jgi:hypothetical protein